VVKIGVLYSACRGVDCAFRSIVGEGKQHEEWSCQRCGAAFTRDCFLAVWLGPIALIALQVIRLCLPRLCSYQLRKLDVTLQIFNRPQMWSRT
jgi:hypothetical protein